MDEERFKSIFSSLVFLNPGNNLFNLLEIQYAGFLLYLVIHSFLKVLYTMRNTAVGDMESQLAISCSQARKASSGRTGLHSIVLLAKEVTWKFPNTPG